MEDLNLSKTEFNERGGWELKREFFEKYFGLRTIPWENRAEIEGILAGKENLTPSTSSVVGEPHIDPTKKAVETEDANVAGRSG